MKIVDANLVLRYLLADEPTLFRRSEQILENDAVHLPFEVLGEVAHRALKTYSAGSLDIVDSLLCGYRSLRGAEVVSFDRQLSRRLRTG